MKKFWPKVIELWPEVTPTGIWLISALVLSVVLDLAHSPLVPLPGVTTLLLIPGAAVMALIATRPANTAGRMVLAVCLSMMAIMVVGGAASLLGPHLGVARPLNSLTESVIWILLAILMLAVCAVKRRDPVTWIFEGVRATHLLGALASGLLVVLSILGVAQLNHSGNNHLAVFATSLDVAVLLAGVIGGWKRTSRWPLFTLLYCVSLALLLSTSLRGGHLYGWDIQKEFGVASRTLRTGVWVVPANHDPFASMLSLTVLPAVLHSLAKLRLLAFFQLVVPAILALLPLAMFSAVRGVPRWVSNGRRVPPRPGLAFAVIAGIIVSSVAFSSLLVSITRQAMAVTMLTAVVMVVFDRKMSVREAQIVIGLLVVAISFTHYTTSYLVAGTLLTARGVGWLWSKGWIGTRRTKIQEHRYNVRSRSVLNSALVVVALIAALGWNLGVTRNNALSNTASAFSTQGAGLSKSVSQGAIISAPEMQKILVSQLKKTDTWIIPVSTAGSVRLKTENVLPSRGLISSLHGFWNGVNFLLDEALWAMLGVALLYGIVRLGRRQSDLYNADLVGLAVAGLMIGALSRFSGTLAALFSPERAAIITAIFLAAPVTMFLDDGVESLENLETRFARASLAVVVAVVGVFAVWATGLGTLLFGGTPPGSLSAKGVNAQQFTVSTTELETAIWLRDHAGYRNVVQTDPFGQLVLLSEPGKYKMLDEIVPKEVDVASYIYLSTVNLINNRTQAETGDFAYASVYQSTISFFNRNFYIVYSTGSTRVYH